MNHLSLVHVASLHVTVSSKFVQYSVQTRPNWRRAAQIKMDICLRELIALSSNSSPGKTYFNIIIEMVLNDLANSKLTSVSAAVFAHQNFELPGDLLQPDATLMRLL